MSRNSLKHLTIEFQNRFFFMTAENWFRVSRLFSQNKIDWKVHLASEEVKKVSWNEKLFVRKYTGFEIDVFREKFGEEQFLESVARF